MSFLNDRQIKRYFLFLIGLILLSFLFGAGLVAAQSGVMRGVLLEHDSAVASSLLEQGVPGETVAAAMANREGSAAGAALLAAAGRSEETALWLFPAISLFWRRSGYLLLAMGMVLAVLLLAGAVLFFRKRERLYRRAAGIISGYIEGDYSRHMPQTGEGTIFQVFAAADQLSTMLQSQNEAEHRAKEFLKETISDISHQLKTPLAALTMYQEIIAEEPDHPDTVKEFSEKIGISLRRMEELILSMLKITRLDAGNIVFEKESYQVSELMARAVSELTTRAGREKKELLLEGSPEERIVCDLEWTSEAVGNIVKNALDHTGEGGKIRITWDHSPYMARIVVSDNGSGILPEDIHHIFKRFYRSKSSLDSQGAGLGLPLAKAIIEGQGGSVSVRSNWGEGTAFTISLLTKS